MDYAAGNDTVYAVKQGFLAAVNYFVCELKLQDLSRNLWSFSLRWMVPSSWVCKDLEKTVQEFILAWQKHGDQTNETHIMMILKSQIMSDYEKYSIDLK